MASPKSMLWWILWVRVCSWLVRAPKVFQLRINQLVVWFVWFVWIVDSLVIRPSPHPRVLTCPFIFKVLRAREGTPTPSFFVIFTFGLAFESFKECWGASFNTRLKKLNNYIFSSLVKCEKKKHTHTKIIHKYHPFFTKDIMLANNMRLMEIWKCKTTSKCSLTI